MPRWGAGDYERWHATTHLIATVERPRNLGGPLPHVTAWNARPSWVVLVGVIVAVVAFVLSPWLVCIALVPMLIGQESGRVTISCVGGTLWVTPASRLAQLRGRPQPPSEPASVVRFDQADRRNLHDYWEVDGRRMSVSRFRRRRMRRLVAAAAASVNRAPAE